MSEVFTSAQCQTLAQAWQHYYNTLALYDATRVCDPGYNSYQVHQAMQSAGSMVSLYGVAGMDAAFDDAVAAFAALQNVTTQASKMVATLTAEANSWNRFAAVVSAMLTLARAVGAMPILNAAVGVAQAYTGNPAATTAAKAADA